MDDQDRKRLERNIINTAVFGETSQISQVFALLTPGHFSHPGCRLVFEILSGYRGDLMEPSDRFDKLMEKIQGKDDLYHLVVYELNDEFHTTVLLDNQVRLLIQVYEQGKVKRAIKTMSTGAMSLDETKIGLQDLAESIRTDTKVKDEENVSELALSVLEDIESMGKHAGYSWGLKRLDRLTGGIQKGMAYVVGGLKKTGKTRFMVNTIAELTAQQTGCAVFSLEMTAKQLARVIMARIGGYTTEVYYHKDTYVKNAKEVSEAAKRFGNLSHLIRIFHTPAAEYYDVENKLREIRNQGIEVVFLDYLQRMDIGIDSRETTAFRFARIANNFANMARREDVAVIFLSQIAARAEGKLAGIADLKESGGIGEAVDASLVLNQQTRITQKKREVGSGNTVEMTMQIDQRSGESGSMSLMADLARSRFYETENYS